MLMLIGLATMMIIKVQIVIVYFFSLIQSFEAPKCKRLYLIFIMNIKYRVLTIASSKHSQHLSPFLLFYNNLSTTSFAINSISYSQVQHWNLELYYHFVQKRFLVSFYRFNPFLFLIRLIICLPKLHLSYVFSILEANSLFWLDL